MKSPRVVLALAVIAWMATSPAAAQRDVRRNSGKGAYQELIRSVLREHYPAALTAASPRRVRYLYLLGDGHGRLVRHEMDSTPPASLTMPEAIEERFEMEVDSGWTDHMDVAFALAGMSMHVPGMASELGPDTLWVFWADAPLPLDSARTLRAGGFQPGLAVEMQVTPDTIFRFAETVPPGHTVWYARDQHGTVMGMGTWEGENPDYAARQAQLAPQFPDGELTCSAAGAIQLADGRLVRILPIRYDPKPSR